MRGFVFCALLLTAACGGSKNDYECQYVCATTGGISQPGDIVSTQASSEADAVNSCVDMGKSDNPCKTAPYTTFSTCSCTEESPSI